MKEFNPVRLKLNMPVEYVVENDRTKLSGHFAGYGKDRFPYVFENGGSSYTRLLTQVVKCEFVIPLTDNMQCYHTTEKAMNLHNSILSNYIEDPAVPFSKDLSEVVMDSKYQDGNSSPVTEYDRVKKLKDRFDFTAGQLVELISGGIALVTKVHAPDENSHNSYDFYILIHDSNSCEFSNVIFDTKRYLWRMVKKTNFVPSLKEKVYELLPLVFNDSTQGKMPLSIEDVCYIDGDQMIYPF